MISSNTGTSFKLGILGGGQLGRMFIQEAMNYNVHVHILENDEFAPAALNASYFTKGDITDFNDVISFGRDMDVLTVEIENVNIEALYELENMGVNVYPQPKILEIIKDKGLQKEFYQKHGIPTSDFQLLDENVDENFLRSQIPFVHKLRTGGYDGKGVQIIKSENDLSKAFREASIAETLIDFEKELSVIVSRNASGQTAVFPTVECEFNDVNLVSFLFSPADIDTSIEAKAKQLAIQVIDAFEMVGILAVEMFLTKDGQLLVNEVAPRPHNSGHHTIECNVTSQFEQHMRAILNWPLGSTDILHQGAMINLIGEDGYTGPAFYEGLESVLRHKNAFIHLYGKETTKPFRKMGHLTIAADSMDSTKKIAAEFKNVIRVITK